MNNYYHLLGLQENASAEQINDAYKKLAQKFHPDKNLDDPFFNSLFEQITEAKQILTDKDKKSEYDLLLTNYSDAFDLFTQQRIEDEFNRQQKRKHFEKATARRKKVAILVSITVLTGLLIFLWLGSKSTLFGSGSKGKFQAIQEIAKDTLYVLKQNLPQKEKLKDSLDNKPSETIIKQEEKVEKIQTAFSKKTLKAKYIKPFESEELDRIYVAIKSEKLKNNYNTNCITIKKTRSSNVDNGFKIGGYLQQRGFIISGREIISGNVEGIHVGFNGLCLTLTIGEM
ncbi:J domain-containing protein [Segetibacter aerophilus]|uniref:J domain-containing protein n=1 Tax=Segetibacter aerophilus TaxID=670293 RepID=A0A512BGX9_9BACT|nr:J domain-containing protein [Segetibacter aerophilus]GEO11228.1 hypothetical protein SAE01_37240 [Segetibacter aerophilus]